MQPLETLVAHVAWANRQLFAALRDVDAFESQSGAALIVRVLDHVHVVSRIFQAHLQGVSHDYESTQSPALPPLEELDRGFEALDRWYLEVTASLSPDELARPRDVRFTDGKVVTMTAATMILHVMTHTIHHRGNVDAIMYQCGMPRRRDGLPEFLISRAPAI
ncbi:MAG TPA: DinB family protein [Polyangiaceae bacterium]|nr:DinB family protein [Polyangiaceae bacterium]